MHGLNHRKQPHPGPLFFSSSFFSFLVVSFRASRRRRSPTSSSLLLSTPAYHHLRHRAAARCPTPIPLLTFAFEENDLASEYHRDAFQPTDRSLGLFNLTARARTHGSSFLLSTTSSRERTRTLLASKLPSGDLNRASNRRRADNVGPPFACPLYVLQRTRFRPTVNETRLFVKT